MSGHGAGHASGHGAAGHGSSHGAAHEEAQEEHEEEHEKAPEEEREEHESHEEHGHGKEHKEEKTEKRAAKKEQPKKKKLIGEIGIFTLILIAVGVRMALKQYEALYSIEPIIPIAVYAGLAYGTDAGVLVGLISYPLSNFFLPGGTFGLWSFLQGLGGAIAGLLAGGVRKVTKGGLVTYTVIGTIIFEILVSFPDQSIYWEFPVRHIITNIIFAIIIGELLIKEK